MDWDKDNQWEKEWWGNCSNVFGEKLKQLTYLARMGIFCDVDTYNGSQVWYRISEGLAIVDIGGGPDSALLQVRNVKGVVVDPCDYPQWTKDRYAVAGIKLMQIKAEDIDVNDESLRFDECWIYNCLQHVVDPEKIVYNAQQISRVIRLFEPVNTQLSIGHPHAFTKEILDKWLKREGTVADVSSNGFFGCAYFGVFPGNL